MLNSVFPVFASEVNEEFEVASSDVDTEVFQPSQAFNPDLSAGNLGKNIAVIALFSMLTGFFIFISNSQNE